MNIFWGWGGYSSVNFFFFFLRKTFYLAIILGSWKLRAFPWALSPAFPNVSSLFHWGKFTKTKKLTLVP